MNLSLAQLGQFAIGALLIVLLPGPNSLFVMTTSAKIGRSAAWRAALGVFLGDGILMLCAVLGAGTLLSAGSWAFNIITTLGALYLAWLAFGLLKRGWELVHIAQAQRRSGPEPATEPTAATMADARYSPFRRSLATSLLNPKATLFFAAFFLQFIDPHDSHMWGNFLVLAGIMQLISLSYLSLLINVSSRVGARVGSRPSAVTAAHILAGCAFLAFAAKLAFA